MKKVILSSLFITSLFAQSIDDIYKEAVNLEKQNKYKEAMLLYKKAVNMKNQKEDDYLLDLSKNKEYDVHTYTTMKKDFYTKHINKTEDKETNSSLEQMITGNFGLYPYRKNYLLPATYRLNEKEGQSKFETAFQFSIEKPISYNFFGLDESISFAYTQKSFWQTSEESSPFRETNYKPEVFVQFPYKNSETLKGYKFALMHESNGRNNEFSRSWNRLYLEGYLQFSNLFLIPRVWYRLPEKEKDDDNSDIHKYYGYGDITLLYPYKKHTFELKVRNNLRVNSDNKGSAELNWTFPLPEFMSSANSYGFLQIFSGYGDSLIDYDEEVNKIGLGIALSR